MPACLLALFLAAAEGADSPPAKLLNEKLSPGSVALLVRYAADPAAAGRIVAALHDSSGEVRATAGRVILVAHARGLLQALGEALAVEENAEAAREEIRAWESLAGPEGDPALFAVAKRFDGRLDWDLARSMARSRGPAAIAVLLADTRLELTAVQWADAFALATRGDAAAFSQALAQVLAAGQAERWEALLRTAKTRKMQLDEAAVAAGLASADARIASRSAWYLAAELAVRPDPAPAVRSALAHAAPGGDADREFALAVLARATGQMPADDAAWLAWIPDAKISFADEVSPGAPVLRWLTPAERDALRHRYDRRKSVKASDEKADAARWEPKTLPEPPPKRLDLEQIRTVADLPRGVASGVLAVSGCSARPGETLALAWMRYNPDGRASRLSPIEMPSGRSCEDAAISLFLLALAPDDEFPILDRPIVLVAISRSDCLAALDEDDVCPSVCPVNGAVRVGGNVQAPKLDQRVEPKYPMAARQEHAEGVVIAEAMITETGCVRAVKILKSVDPRLDLEAARAISQWKYLPAHIGDRPVKVYLTVTVTYKLKG